MRRVLMLGPDLIVRGGVASVENVILEGWHNKKNKIHFLPTHRDLSKFGKLLFAIKSQIILIIKLLKLKPHIIYIHMSQGASFYRKSISILISILFFRDIVIHMHGSEFDQFYNSKNSLNKWYIRGILGFSKKVIVLSEKWRAFYNQIVEDVRIEVVHNSVEVLDENMYKTDSKNIIFMGILGDRKGVYDILKVAPEILRNNEDLCVYLAGDGEVEKVKKIAGEHHKENRIIVPGWIGKKEKEILLSDAAIFLLPSYAEGLPMAILEAMAYGIPVISSNVGGIPELIKDGENGFIIEPGDTKMLKEKIELLLKESNLRKKISGNAHNTIKENFNKIDYIKRIEIILSE